jgi:hypothetical protein
MPSFSATLSLSSTKAGKIGDFEVLKCRIDTGRTFEVSGLPTSKRRAVKLELSIVISEGEVVIGSVFDSNDLVKGTIEFKKIDENTKFRTIKFDKSWIVEYEEIFEPGEKNSMVLNFSVTAGTIEIDGVSATETWTNQVG